MTTKLDQLLAELCPEGVEFEKLGELLDYEQPTKYIVKSTKYDHNYKTPVLTAGQSFILWYTNEDDWIFMANKENPVIIFDDFTTSFHWVDFDFKIKSSAMKMLRWKWRNSYVKLRFIYYAMKCISFTPADHSRHWISKYSNFQIPIPPLPVQEEIVKILDKFTSLEAELEAELEARKCQYEFYRNQLLAFKGGGDVLYKPLSELWILIRWNGLQKSDFVSEGKPCIHYGQIYTHYGTTASRTISQIAPELFDKLKKAEKGDVLIAWTSENIQDVNKSLVRIGDEQVAISGDMFAFRPTKTLLLPQFLNYYLQSNHYFDYKKKHARGTKVVRIPSEKILEFLIPLPPLEQQEAIVYILDHFDQLANDLTAGLPAELHLRQQQYTYYRDILLNFSSELVSEREREH